MAPPRVGTIKSGAEKKIRSEWGKFVGKSVPELHTDVVVRDLKSLKEKEKKKTKKVESFRREEKEKKRVKRKGSTEKKAPKLHRTRLEKG